MGAKIKVSVTTHEPPGPDAESRLSKALDDKNNHLLGAILQEGDFDHEDRTKRATILVHLVPPCTDPEHILAFADALEASAAELRQQVKQ